ncbi:glycosyltransferase [Candidatus Nitrososphaera gargensis]|nr:glycosyltransferase [Candidatus Nitrososphaera gargensis]
MKANVVHMDLNPCGGAEQVAIATIQALVEMDIDVELTTARIPDISRLKKAFGSERIDAFYHRIRRLNLFHRLPVESKDRDAADDEVVTINTHGDMLPYYLSTFSSSNAITYCHYPLVTEFSRVHDLAYLQYLRDLGLIKMDGARAGSNNDMRSRTQNSVSRLWQELEESYLAMLKHSTIVTNSTFSRDAILKVLSRAPYGNNNIAATRSMADPIVIPPPVNVEEFRRAALYSRERDNFIVVISRFNPSKKLENAIALAHVLKKLKIGKKMIIVGGLMPEDRNYHDHILRMIKSCDLSDYIALEVNATSDILKSIMRKAKVYFHPMPGEPFGISIAEAMSAGLIPIVPDIGGHTDFVPEKYRFSSLEDAAMKISSALNASQEEREKVSDIVSPFSFDRYIESIQGIIGAILSKEQVRHKTDLDAYQKARQDFHGTAAA